jgi:hypothetical protein
MFYFKHSRYASASTKNQPKNIILGVAGFCWGNGCTHQPNCWSMQLVDAGRCSSGKNRGNTGDSVHRPVHRPSVASTSHTLCCLHARLNSPAQQHFFPFSTLTKTEAAGALHAPPRTPAPRLASTYPDRSARPAMKRKPEE